MAFALPRPGPVLKVALILLAATGLVGAIVFNWLPGGDAGARPFVYLTCSADRVWNHHEIWRLFTAGLLTKPGGQGAIGHLMMTLLGLYFLSPDLEKRWGGARFAWFLVASIVAGYALAVLVDLVAAPGLEAFHPALTYGAAAAISATAVAWSRENAETEVRLFFVLPVKGKYLFWFTVLYCLLGVLYSDTMPEGAVAPFGGILVGLLLGGSPSVVRSIYLQTKLAMLRKKAGGRLPSMHVSPKRPKPGSPPLRVVQGGLEEELKKRQPPKDKRYLN